MCSSDLVKMETNYGDIILELNQEKAPITVKNFLQYTDNKFYDGTIFHRVINNFMIQGGGLTKDMKKKTTLAEIKNEADNGLKNEVGTIAMARTNVVDSATSQFFINVKDNNFLNHRGKNPRDYGYTVFGKVTEGMTVVNRIKTGDNHKRWPSKCPNRANCYQKSHKALKVFKGIIFDPLKFFLPFSTTYVSNKRNL